MPSKAAALCQVRRCLSRKVCTNNMNVGSIGMHRAHCGHLLEGGKLGCAARAAALPQGCHVVTEHGHLGLQGCHLPVLSCHGRLQGMPTGQLTCHCISLHTSHLPLASLEVSSPKSEGGDINWYYSGLSVM